MLPKDKAKQTGDLTDEELSNLSDTDLLDLHHSMKRHVDFAEHQIDFKHAMHLVRLLRMCSEVLKDGVVNVRRPDAEELLAIRNGAWTYDELVSYAESLDKYNQTELFPKSVLPAKPNLHLAAELIMDVQDLTWLHQK